jgi:UDP-N-acetyl-D-galactosamine dehydrogenase
MLFKYILMKNDNFKIAVIWLGYVGLPLAIEFGKKFKVLDFDISTERINELTHGHNCTMEADLDKLSEVRYYGGNTGLDFYSNPEDLK